MKKVFITFVIFMCVFSVFAAGTKESDDRDEVKKTTNKLGDKKDATAFTNACRNMINTFVNNCINTMENVYPSKGTSGMGSGTIKGENKWNLFQCLFGFCFALEVMLYSINIVTNPSSALAKDTMDLLIRLLTCALLFYYIWKLPSILIDAMKYCAGILIGDVGWAREFKPGNVFLMSHDAAAAGAMGLTMNVLSSFQFSPLGVGVTGAALGSIGHLCTMIFFADMTISFVTAMMVAVWYIELYFMNIVMFMCIPTMVFKGFVTDIKSVVRAYFFQGLKIMLAIVVYCVSAASVSGLKEWSNVLFAVFYSLIRSTLIGITMKSIPGLINAIHRGSAVDESGASGLAQQAIGALNYFGSGVLGTGLSGWVGSMGALTKLQQQKDKEDNNQTMGDISNSGAFASGQPPVSQSQG